MNRYCHVSTPVSSDDLARIGFGVSEAKIFFAVVWHESHGKAGIVNNWDNQHVSWGLVQYAGKAGSLASLFCTLKNDAESSFDYNNVSQNPCTASYRCKNSFSCVRYWLPTA